MKVCWSEIRMTPCYHVFSKGAVPCRICDVLQVGFLFFFFFFLFYYASFKMLSAGHDSHREMDHGEASGLGPAYTVWPVVNISNIWTFVLKHRYSGTVHFLSEALTKKKSRFLQARVKADLTHTSMLLAFIAQVNTDGLFLEKALQCTLWTLCSLIPV